MTPDEAIEKARWYEREDIATTLREEANVLADECERLRTQLACSMPGLVNRLEALTDRAQGRELEEIARLASENVRLRERVVVLEEALVHISIQDGEELTPLADHAAHTLADGLRHCGEVARAALKGTP